MVRRGVTERIPRFIKRPLKRLFCSVNFYDPRLVQLRLDGIRPDDIFLCSYPKSGNTWLRFLIANLTSGGEEVTFRNIEKYVPEIIRSENHVNKLQKRPVMKTHWPLYDLFPKTIYIYRDPRDTLISYHHYMLKNHWFKGQLSEFLRSPLPDQYGNWSAHIEGALAQFAKDPQRICILKYENMLGDPDGGLKQIVDFLKWPHTDDQVRTAVRNCQFENLKKIEIAHGGEKTGLPVGFFRRGQAGQWQDSLCEEDLAYIYKRFGSTMTRLGYGLS